MPVYKTKKVVQNGKVVRKKTRVGGVVHRTPAQKQAQRKASLAAQKPGAKKKRLRSVVKRGRYGLDAVAFDYADLLTSEVVSASLYKDSRGIVVGVSIGDAEMRTNSQSEFGVRKILDRLGVSEVGGMSLEDAIIEVEQAGKSFDFELRPSRIPGMRGHFHV